ncbi:Uncharacterized phage-associated protein [Cohaesibacter sp. ES.047]|uniref:Panacea domain-containing protein n=1 Tax=Cohaesibacter sp. ES.047 TaxID=1798205 RepID=UPI000BB73E74|nr:type II toxin-antitoxin system antitoxin SocA domain-containing protein [Cohaesibacter sp. ES.047]SNY93490.1 Uncharacterized phage-associated protein [Cohaesibacter sp. ES.047]
MICEAEKYQESTLLADYLICESRERGELLTPLKLQKLMYYADAWHLALYDKEITPEQFQAWVHGPVALSQYHRFKGYKWRPIDEEIEKPDLKVELKKHIDEVIDVFGSETAVALEIMTHKERPWISARGDISEDEPCNAYISKKITKEFYQKIAD